MMGRWPNSPLRHFVPKEHKIMDSPLDSWQPQCLFDSIGPQNSLTSEPLGMSSFELSTSMAQDGASPPEWGLARLEEKPECWTQRAWHANPGSNIYKLRERNQITKHCRVSVPLFRMNKLMQAYLIRWRGWNESNASEFSVPVPKPGRA